MILVLFFRPFGPLRGRWALLEKLLKRDSIRLMPRTKAVTSGLSSHVEPVELI